MTIVHTIQAPGDSFFYERCTAAGFTSLKVDHAKDFVLYPDACLFIDASFDGFFADLSAPLLFHAPAHVFAELPLAPMNSGRFCAWPGFLERSVWEIATPNGLSFPGESIMAALGIKLKLVKDIPGLIGPRVLSTIINEAAFTIAEGVAAAADIDTAMRLGTNYPKGPVEWAKEIGCTEVNSVLMKMGQENRKYMPHPALCELF
ncbi:MAG: 3-hydroxyacyl-CoA dehydrogenase family protein [Chitinophagaceae bacterium]|nr:3-hydroxyacyl-CoA dehydrogenase family protein [Chitinophagaceae bacterium]